MCSFARVLARKRAEQDMQRAMREFARAAKAYSRKVAAAIRIQASRMSRNAVWAPRGPSF